MRPYILLAPLAAILFTACSDGNADGDSIASQEVDKTITTTPATSPPTTVKATTTTVAPLWSRETLVAMEPCLSTLRLIVADGADDFLVEDAFDECDPASDQVKVDADLSGTVETAEVSLAMGFMLIAVTGYRVGQADAADVESSAASFLETWEKSAP